MKIYGGATCSSSSYIPPFDEEKYMETLRNKAAAGSFNSVSEYLSYEKRQRPGWCTTVSQGFEKCERKYGRGSFYCDTLRGFLLECTNKKKDT